MEEVSITQSLYNEKHAGIFAPLFSFRSSCDWGIGDFKSLTNWIEWAVLHKTRIVQILAINEIPPNTTSPYSSISAFAIDPIYLSLEEGLESYPEMQKLVSSAKIRNTISILNKSPSVDYQNVRQLKNKILKCAFDIFFKKHWVKHTQLSDRFKYFQRINSHWLEHYAVFRTAKDVYDWHSWTHWNMSLKSSSEDAIKKFAARHSYEILYYKYLQWLCYRQLEKVKKFANDNGVLLFGDVPFIINQESSDVWSNQDIFDITTEIGAPPDDLNTGGQKWGLPAYNWWNLEAGNFKWWRMRVRNICGFFNLFRLDHIVGFFRTWIISKYEKKSGFDLPDEHEQKARGERFLTMITQEAKSCRPVAEDLGLVPDFTRDVLRNFAIAGYKVLRWECDGDIFRDPLHYPGVSLATTSTHDTSTLKKWWNTADETKRNNLWKVLTGKTEKAPKFNGEVHCCVIKRLLESSSSVVIFPLQDLFAIDGRINTPGTVTGHNWTWRFPVEVEKIKNHKQFEHILQYYDKILASSGRAMK